MLVIVMVVMVMVMMVMAVEITIENKVLMECMQFEKFVSFCNSILHMVRFTQHSLNSSLIGIVHGRQL